MSRYFIITQEAKDSLSQKCPKMAKLIAGSDSIKRKVTPDLFTALCHSIIGQQISIKAAATVCERFDALFSEISPQALYRKRDATIQKCGLSQRKVAYLKGVAKAAIYRDVDFDQLSSYSEEAFTASLTSLKGVGVWTAEMLLLFSLERPNILSYGDLAIRNAIMELHQLDSLTRQEFQHYKTRYAPYCSTASMYLWNSQKKK